MPTEDEIYDAMLANAGKCPHCGEFLFIEKQEMLGIYQVCLSKECDYRKTISNPFNEKMGLEKEKAKESLYDGYKELLKTLEENRSTKKLYCAAKKESIATVPAGYWSIDDKIEHTLRCPNCYGYDIFDINYEAEYCGFKYVCKVCGAEFRLTNMDFRDGIGTMEMIKKGKPQPDKNLKKVV